ncbi:uncharacterized protein LOC126376784 isoform X2 [Pectinophora gossypiella]|uniref:uncharacterized protein LOC126376784 isoform X2 n=1 Tax=Pectinophora gossypiella TaxID=13191 RepID=UPI00214E980B|nr:uncharacterized protein LOC126376784 isoform X2 [Pectinophora gossypiella]
MSQRNLKCPCNYYKANQDFQKITTLEDVGLTIYRHIGGKTNAQETTLVMDVMADENFVLENSSNLDIMPEDFVLAFEQNKISCQHCKNIVEHIERLLKSIQVIKNRDTRSICAHCRSRPETQCPRCQEILRRFNAAKKEDQERCRINKRVVICLNKVPPNSRTVITVMDRKSSKDTANYLGDHSPPPISFLDMGHLCYPKCLHPSCTRQLYADDLSARTAPPHYRSSKLESKLSKSRFEHDLEFDSKMKKYRSDDLLVDSLKKPVQPETKKKFEFVFPKSSKKSIVVPDLKRVSSSALVKDMLDKSHKDNKEKEKNYKIEKIKEDENNNLKLKAKKTEDEQFQYTSLLTAKKYKGEYIPETFEGEKKIDEKNKKKLVKGETESKEKQTSKILSDAKLRSSGKSEQTSKEKGDNVIKHKSDIQIDIKRRDKSEEKKGKSNKDNDDKTTYGERKGNIHKDKGNMKRQPEEKGSLEKIKGPSGISQKHNQIKGKSQSEQILKKEKSKARNKIQEMFAKESKLDAEKVQNNMAQTGQNTDDKFGQKRTNEEIRKSGTKREQGVNDLSDKGGKVSKSGVKDNEIDKSVKGKDVQNLPQKDNVTKAGKQVSEISKRDENTLEPSEREGRNISAELPGHKSDKVKNLKAGDKSRQKESIGEVNKETTKKGKKGKKEKNDANGDENMDTSKLLKYKKDKDVSTKEKGGKKKRFPPNTIFELPDLFNEIGTKKQGDYSEKEKKRIREKQFTVAELQQLEILKDSLGQDMKLKTPVLRGQNSFRNQDKEKKIVSNLLAGIINHLPIVSKHRDHSHKSLASDCIVCHASDVELDLDSWRKGRNNKAALNKYIKCLKVKQANNYIQQTDEGEDHIFEFKSLEPVEKKPEVKNRKKKAPEPYIGGKGILRYALSDRTFIENGWTVLPVEKVIRRMNVYRMRPVNPEFDWFEHNKSKGYMTYDTGEKLAEINDNGHGTWYYRSGRLALDYYGAEEMNAERRFVIYSSGEKDQRGRSYPITVLATFDYLGNGIVFDHSGKIRLKYNQAEGIVLDRGIGPVSHWKWHSLNDPPILQQVMMDTSLYPKDKSIRSLGHEDEKKEKPINEEMLEIELQNLVKETDMQSSTQYQPYQIKMKALKINDQFSLRILDQKTIYLIFRDGTTHLKLNLGMVLDQDEVLDTVKTEIGEVHSTNFRPPATDSLADIQRKLAIARNFDRVCAERERRLRPQVPVASVDRLIAGVSHPRPQVHVLSPASSARECYKHRKPPLNMYYDTRLI